MAEGRRNNQWRSEGPKAHNNNMMENQEMWEKEVEAVEPEVY
jgi:hypothetical protein